MYIVIFNHCINVGNVKQFDCQTDETDIVISISYNDGSSSELRIPEDVHYEITMKQSDPAQSIKDHIFHRMAESVFHIDR